MVQALNMMVLLNGQIRHEAVDGSINEEEVERMKVQTLGRGFAWLDTGTHDSLAEASTYIEVIEKRQGLKVACLEGIADKDGRFICEYADAASVDGFGHKMLTGCGKYLENYVKAEFGINDSPFLGSHCTENESVGRLIAALYQ